jgi:hypothetical protein
MVERVRPLEEIQGGLVLAALERLLSFQTEGASRGAIRVGRLRENQSRSEQEQRNPGS